jgi:hypothetical protein
LEAQLGDAYRILIYRGKWFPMISLAPISATSMTPRIVFSFLCLTSLISLDALADTSDRGPKGLGSVLIFSGTGWYRHPEIIAVNRWLVQTCGDSGILADVSETPRDLEKLLSHYDVLVLNNANTLSEILNVEQRAAVEDWYRDGGAIVALHAALVHQEGWPWLQGLAGCDFNSDSEYLKAKVVVDPKARNHPSVNGFGKAFWYTADWTNHDKSVTGLEGLQVLLRVDESTFEPVREYFQTRGGKAMGEDHPIAWIREYDGGRFFYTEFGHDVRSLDTKFGRQHIIEGIRWAAGDK